MLAFTPQEIQRHMAQHPEGLRPVVFANPARILSKGHLQDPMHFVLHAPVLPHRVAEPPPISGQGGERIPSCDLPRLPVLTTGLYHAQTLYIGPRRLRSSPVDRGGDPIRAAFYAPMIAIHRFMISMGSLGKRIGPSLIEKQCHIVIAGAVILLQRSDIIRPLLGDHLGALLLPPHRLHGDGGTR